VYDLIVRDNGIGMPVGIAMNDTKTMGMQLISTLVEHQLGERLKLDRTHGTEFHIRFKEASYKKRL